MSETIAHLAFQVVHEVVCLRRRLLLEVFQELARHVRALRQHVIQITQSLLPRLLFILDVSVHLGALTLDVGHNLTFIRDSCLFLLDQAIGDAFDLRSDGEQSVIVVLNSVLFFLDESGLEFIPTTSTAVNSRYGFSSEEAEIAETYIRS